MPRSPFVAVGEKVRGAVVNIRTVRSVTRGGVDINPLQEMFRQFFPGGDESRKERMELPSSGSGFLVSEDGDVLTNHHVIAEADAVFVRFTGEQREYTATVAGIDPNTDLALLRIEMDGPRPPLEFGNSDAVAVGDWAVAIGNPFGHLEGSLTVGVVSAKGRTGLEIAGNTMRYQDFIQTDASINFGNSGGPLVDILGRVIGVNTAVNTGGQGIGFAIPGNFAMRIYRQLRDHGRVIRGYLGVRTEAVLEPGPDVEAHEAAEGARIVVVLPDTPAARAGLQEGDVVLSFAGQAITSPNQLQFLVADAEPGQELECQVERDGRRLTRRVTMAEMPPTNPQTEAVQQQWLGLEVASLVDPSPRAEQLKATLGVTGTVGVLVLKVIPDSPAAAAGIRPGDVLEAVDDFEIADLAAYRRLRAQLAGRQEPLRFRVRTGSVENYILVHPSRRGVEQ
jgi:S1-C subfamily serine protease